MRSTSKFILTALLVALVAAVTPSRSQEVQARRLTLKDAVRLAMKYNSDLKSARLDVEKSDAKVTEAWGNALPAVDVSGTYTRTLKTPVFFAIFNGQPMAIEMGFPHSLTMALTGKQILFTGAVIAGVGAARVYSKMARDLYMSKQLEAVTVVRKAYSTVLLAREVVDMMHSTMRNAEDNLKNVLLMRKEGIVSEYDELRASVQVENLRPDVIRSENNYELSLDALRSAIGLGKEESFEVADSLTFTPVDDTVVSRAEELVTASNPGLSAMARQIELNGAVVFAERSNYMPTIAAFGQYQYQAAKDRLTFGTNDLIASSMIGVTVSMNIFQGMQTRARVEQAQLDEQKSVEQKTSLERNLRTGVHSIVATSARPASAWRRRSGPWRPPSGATRS
jgi:outer membrane protein